MNQLKLFQMIDELSRCHFARIREKNGTVYITFFTRPEMEIVCKWTFEKYFFNKELKDLFNKHNSVTTVTGKEQK